ncbi:MAG: hypothetical protein S0880_10530 [Actinomycetota bacterium]|nr:hypothetical protein [Actinomycetota bacterium]
MATHDHPDTTGASSAGATSPATTGSLHLAHESLAGYLPSRDRDRFLAALDHALNGPVAGGAEAPTATDDPTVDTGPRTRRSRRRR